MMSDRHDHLPEFFQDARGEVRVNESMSRHTSWRTGGCADYFYTPADKDDLLRLLVRIPADVQVHWIGLGSNLLVRDGGVDGVVIRTSKGLSEIKILPDAEIYIESGVSCAKVAKVTVGNNFSGMEFLAGVPGSFGGALAMNAGAFGRETWDRVKRIECINRAGVVTVLDKADVSHGYRRVDLCNGHCILSGTLKLDIEGAEFEGKAAIRRLLDKRSRSQPVQTANAGSVFRNPQGGFAAKLIEQSGLKGFAIGGARISDLHANFIINDGTATAKDIETLIQHARNTVDNVTGVRLVPEVRIIGRET